MKRIIIEALVIVFLLAVGIALAETISGTFYNGVTFPYWNDNLTFPSSGIAYSKSSTYSFQINWYDASGFTNATFMSNYTESWVNYTKLTDPAVSNTSQIYWINLTDIPAGTIGYKWFGFSASGTDNSTDLLYYIINKKPTTIDVYINGSESDKYYEYGSILNLSTSINSEYPVNICLSLNDTAFGDCFDNNTAILDTGQLTLSGNITYNLTASFSGDDNHTESYKTIYLYVADTISPLFQSYWKNTTYINFNQSIQVIANATDMQPNDTAFLEMYLPNSSTFNYTMSLLSNGNFSRNFTKSDFGDFQPNAGKINITRLFVNDSGNNIIVQNIGELFDYATTSLLIANAPDPVGNSTDSETISAAYMANDTFSTPINSNCSVNINNTTYWMSYNSGLNRITISLIGWHVQRYDFNVSCINDSYESQIKSGKFDIVTAHATTGGGGGVVPWEILKGGLNSEIVTLHDNDSPIIKLNTTNVTIAYTIHVDYINASAKTVKFTISSQSSKVSVVVYQNKTYNVDVNNDNKTELKINILNFSSSANVKFERIQPVWLTCGNGVCDDDESSLDCPIDCNYDFSFSPAGVHMTLLPGQVGDSMVSVINPTASSIVVEADITGADSSADWAFFGSAGTKTIMYIVPANTTQPFEFQVAPPFDASIGTWKFTIRLKQELRGGVEIPVTIETTKTSGNVDWLLSMLNEDHKIPLSKYFYLPPLFQGNYILWRWMWVIYAFGAFIIFAIVWIVLSFFYRRIKRTPRYYTSERGY